MARARARPTFPPALRRSVQAQVRWVRRRYGEGSSQSCYDHIPADVRARGLVRQRQLNDAVEAAGADERGVARALHDTDGGVPKRDERLKDPRLHVVSRHVVGQLSDYWVLAY